MSEFTKLKKVSAETKSAITRKSAQTLPNNPSERGYSAEEIKRRFYQPIIDAANSALAEIDRIVDEANTAISQVNGSLDNFVTQSNIKEAYKLTLNKDTWVLNSQTKMYEVTIDATTHGITNYKEVGVDMYLLDGNGNYISVNQYEIENDATVRCFHENNGAGYISIYVKREGFIVGNSAVNAGQVIGLAKVGLTNNYNDLDDKPNLEKFNDNEEIIAKMISGAQQVYKAKYANEAETAKYSSTSGTADSATNAGNAEKAVADQYGVNISNGYCKKSGNYPKVKVGEAALAEKAKADEEGVNLKLYYAKQSGIYPNMTAGKATRAESAANADLADKARQDSNGANIADTYVRKNGNYQSLTVGKAAESENVSRYINGKEINSIFENDGITVNNATNAQFAKYASADIKKGTIEERLTKLGFKEGVVDIIEDNNATISVNSLKKQGKHVLFDFCCRGMEIIGKIPSDFMPKSGEIIIYGREDTKNNPRLCFATITSDRRIIIPPSFPGSSTVFEHVGWETK